MNNQLFHITNHWALEKNRKNLKAEVYFDDGLGITYFCRQKPIFAGKNIFASPVFTMEKRFFHLLAKTCHPWSVCARDAVTRFDFCL